MTIDPSMTVVQITQKTAFILPEMWELIKRAFKDGPILPGKALEALVDGSFLNAGVVFAGVRDGKWQGLLMVVEPGWLSVDPQVFQFYCHGGAKMRDELIRQGMAWGRAGGWERVIGFNWRKENDTAWIKAFKAAGVAEQVGTIYAFKLGDEEDGREQRKQT